MLQKLRRSEGFTLLELLVVVAIIAILATLILANLNRARRQAQDAKVQSEVKAVSDAIQLYLTENPSGLSPLTNNYVQLSATTPGISVLTAGTDPVLRSLPTHPSNGSTVNTSYRIRTTNAPGVFSYSVAGYLPAKGECFIITDGTNAAVTPGADCPAS